MLADFVSSLDNLPSEVHHILQEIGHKEARAYDFRNRAASRDQNIQKHARPQAQGGMGLLVVNPKEEGAISKIRYVGVICDRWHETGADGPISGMTLRRRRRQHETKWRSASEESVWCVPLCWPIPMRS